MKISTFFWRLPAALGAVIAAPIFSMPNDESVIQNLLMTTWNKPDAPLSIAAIVIEKDAAIADWLQNQKGGRALLIKHQDKWQVVVCGGDGLKKPETLQQSGVTEATANNLISKLSQAEKGLSKQQISQLASFGDVAAVESKAHHEHHKVDQDHHHH